MNSGFIGRERELRSLGNRLDVVKADGAGVAVTLRGRRQVGKSRLVQELCERSGVPYFFFAATKGESPTESVRHFCQALNRSAIMSDRDPVPILESGSWRDAWGLLAANIGDATVIVVIDELPWLAEQDTVFDGALQTAWDRLLSPKPILLCLLGSDIHMMERLTAYDRPFYGRAANMILDPFTPAESARATGLSGAAALDAHLASGGIPGILRSWPHQTPALEVLKRACDDPLAPVFNVPETALMAEFPAPDSTRRVLEAVGSGYRTHANIAAVAGARGGTVPSGTLSPILARLTSEKHVLAVEEPLSTRPGKPALYRVTDTNLSLYFAALREAHELVRRGQSTVAYRVIERRWAPWRGRAIEPVVREAVRWSSATSSFPWPETEAVGGWWNRQFNPEIDLVGADKAPIASRLQFTGTVKWLGTPVDDHDLRTFAAAAQAVPGYDIEHTGHMVVSLSGTKKGTDLDGIDLVWGPDEVLAAWQ